MKLWKLAPLLLLVGCGGGGTSVGVKSGGSVFAGNYSGESRNYGLDRIVYGPATMTVGSGGQVTIDMPDFNGVDITATGNVSDDGTFTGDTTFVTPGTVQKFGINGTMWVDGKITKLKFALNGKGGVGQIWVTRQ